MKHLTTAESQQELLELKQLLEIRGIPALLQPELAPYKKAELYILIDEQYNDAFSLMSDPNHIVANPVDAETIAQLENEVASMGDVLWGSIGKYAAPVVVSIIVLFIFLVGLLS